MAGTVGGSRLPARSGLWPAGHLWFGSVLGSGNGRARSLEPVQYLFRETVLLM